MGNLYIARHGTSVYNVQKVWQGSRLDIPLHPKGLEDALKLSEIFRTVNIDVIISSPAERAIGSVKPLADYNGVEIIIDVDLLERNHGYLEGTSHAQFKDRYSIFEFFYHNKNKENGEPMEKVYERAERVKEKLIKNYSNKDILIMSHGGFISVLCCVMKGEKLTYRPEHVIGNVRFNHYKITEDEKIIQLGLNLEKI